MFKKKSNTSKSSELNMSFFIYHTDINWKFKKNIYNASQNIMR